MLFSASKGYMPTAYNIPSKVTSVSHMWSTYNMTRSRNCERLILKHKLLKTTPPSPYSFPFSVKGSQLRRSKRLYLKHQTKNWSMIHLAASILLLTTSSRTGESISPAYVQTLQYPQRTWLQCADPTVIKQWMLTYVHLSCDSPLQFIFIYCLMTKASFHLLIGILLPIFN